MSLVVCEIHDDRVSLVADTKVTYGRDYPGDARQATQLYKYAFPKLMIVREDVCVGVAGNNPVAAMKAIAESRGQPVDALLSAMVGMPHASFLLAELDRSPRLWRVAGGVVENRSDIGRAWIGDHSAYEVFQQQYSAWSHDVTDAEFRLLSSLQWLLSFGACASVGGYHTRIYTTSSGFRFARDSTFIAPWLLEVIAASWSQATLSIEMAVPAGGDATGMELRPAVGIPPTIGALAYYVAPAGFGLVFPHEAPWDPALRKAASIEELVALAVTELGQALTA